MADPHGVEVRGFLRSVRRRWRTAAALGALARVVGAGAVLAAAVLALDRWVQPPDLLLIAVAAVALLATAVIAFRQFRPLRRPPSDRQVARFVEERHPELEDRLASAAETPYPGLDDNANRFRALVLRETARAVRGIPLEGIVPTRRLHRALIKLVGGGMCVAAVVLIGAPGLERIARSAWLHAVPYGARLEVEPGDARVVAGQPLVIRARLAGTPGAPHRTLPTVTVVPPGAGAAEVLPMRRAGDGYEAEVAAVEGSFTYRVRAAAVSSPEFTVTALEAPRVERIEAAYRYPAPLGLPPRTAAGGDVRGPQGTQVTLTVVADQSIESGALRLAGGGTLALAPRGGRRWAASFELRRDDAYRVALVDADGLTNPDGPEHLIRVVADRPPIVAIERPGGDREITPLEETVIEAWADDDFGVERFELVYTVAGRDEHVVDLLDPPGARGRLDVTAAHTLRAETLGVRPGDVIRYHVRARDADGSHRARESRSDIFFLEVRPFAREFAEAGSQFLAAMDAGGLGRLVRAQKEILIATWRLDGLPADARPADDLAATAAAQDELRGAATRAAAEAGGGGPGPGDEGLAQVAEAMRAAAESLRAHDTAAAIPSEMAALNGLLRARADVRRTEVSLQPSPGGGFGPQPQEDLSALFDRELRREQRTNYEQRSAASPPTPGRGESDARRRVRELAERQEALNRALAQAPDDAADAETRRRTLARLTREQEALRRQAEEVERRWALPSAGSGGGGRRGGAPRAGTGGRIADGMREAQEALGSGRSADAARAGRAAAERLRGLERALGGRDSAGAELRRLAAAAQRLADARRRAALAAQVAGDGPSGDAARRMLAGEREALAERVEAFAARLEAARRGAAGAVRRALDDIAAGLAQASAGERRGADAGRAAEPGAAGSGAAGSGAQGEAGGAPRPGAAGSGAAGPGAQGEAGGLARDDEALAAALDGAAAGLRAAAQAADESEWASLRAGLGPAEGGFPPPDADAAAEAASRADGPHVGPGEPVPEGHRPLVERYYRSLAERP